jgi:hypothetical protein
MALAFSTPTSVDANRSDARPASGRTTSRKKESPRGANTTAKSGHATAQYELEIERVQRDGPFE